jgi:hypothetical protein
MWRSHGAYMKWTLPLMQVKESSGLVELGQSGWNTPRCEKFRWSCTCWSVLKNRGLWDLTVWLGMWSDRALSAVQRFECYRMAGYELEVSFTYYTKYAMSGDSVVLKYNEFEDGYAIIVPGFHYHILEAMVKISTLILNSNGRHLTNLGYDRTVNVGTMQATVLIVTWNFGCVAISCASFRARCHQLWSTGTRSCFWLTGPVLVARSLIWKEPWG